MNKALALLLLIVMDYLGGKLISQKLYKGLFFILITCLLVNCNNDINNASFEKIAEPSSYNSPELEVTERSHNVSDCLSERACQMQEAINLVRESYGLNALKFDVTCALSAQSFAQDMFENGYFSHVDLLGRRAMQRYEVYKSVSSIYENLGRGTEDVQSMIEAWLRSPSHRDNLLNPNPSHHAIGVFGEGSATRWVHCMIGS